MSLVWKMALTINAVSVVFNFLLIASEWTRSPTISALCVGVGAFLCGALILNHPLTKSR